MRASGRPWSRRHEPQRARANDLWSRTLRSDAQTMRPKEDPHTRDCEGCGVAVSNREHRGLGDAQRNKLIQEERTKRTENLHTQDKATKSDATKAK